MGKNRVVGWAKPLYSLYLLHEKQEKMRLNSIQISGFRSISNSGANLEIGDITVLLGANGVGKSNLVAFFSMLNFMMTGGLQNFVAKRGFAESILNYGSKKTPQINAKIEFADGNKLSSYEFTLTRASGDILIFTEEVLEFRSAGTTHPQKIILNPGMRESDLLDFSTRSGVVRTAAKTASIILQGLRRCKVFHFHDTSPEARIRSHGAIQDNRFLNHDGGNLAAFLFMLQSQSLDYYNRITREIQMIVPEFGDFDLAPDQLNPRFISLNWRDKHRPEYLLGPHQFSDGTLRFIALTTLLLQPPRFLPAVIVLDEPELGLHPSAIGHLAAMVHAATEHAQIIIATQSARLVDEFELRDIVIVERDDTNYSTIFKRFDEENLQHWLEDYSLSELWEKNVIGGQP